MSVGRVLSQETRARSAYEAWREEVQEPRLPAWELASEVTQGAWIARVAMWDERPWTVMQDHGVLDRFTREACEAEGRA